MALEGILLVQTGQLHGDRNPSEGGENAVAPGKQASGSRSSSGCMKPESRASHALSTWETSSAHKGLIRSSQAQGE